jgi:hypothetical protein
MLAHEKLGREREREARALLILYLFTYTSTRIISMRPDFPILNSFELLLLDRVGQYYHYWGFMGERERKADG